MALQVAVVGRDPPDMKVRTTFAQKAALVRAAGAVCFAAIHSSVDLLCTRGRSYVHQCSGLVATRLVNPPPYIPSSDGLCVATPLEHNRQH